MSDASSSCEYDAFLTHDWGIDEYGRENHKRVGLINSGLKHAGVSAWFDEEQMRGDINKQMTKGIDDSACMIVFVTKRYITKAGGEGPNGDDDNCKFEFDYALRRKGVAKMIACVMEPQCRNPKDWEGVVGGKLGGLLYIDLSDDATLEDKVANELVDEVNKVTDGDVGTVDQSGGGAGGGGGGGHPRA